MPCFFDDYIHWILPTYTTSAYERRNIFSWLGQETRGTLIKPQ